MLEYAAVPGNVIAIYYNNISSIFKTPKPNDILTSSVGQNFVLYMLHMLITIIQSQATRKYKCRLTWGSNGTQLKLSEFTQNQVAPMYSLPVAHRGANNKPILVHNMLNPKKSPVWYGTLDHIEDKWETTTCRKMQPNC